MAAVTDSPAAAKAAAAADVNAAAAATVAAEAAPCDASALFQGLHAELRRLARHALWKHGGGVSLSPTTVVHEAYLSLTLAKAKAEFPDPARFLGYVMKVMRGLVINHVRRRNSQKRGGGLQFTQLDTQAAVVEAPGVDVEAVHEALQELEVADARLAKVVVLHFFCGLDFAEIAALLGETERNVQRHWATARGLLRQSLSGEALPTDAKKSATTTVKTTAKTTAQSAARTAAKAGARAAH